MGIWGPLLINILAMAGAVFIVGLIIQNFVFPQGYLESGAFQNKICFLGFGLLLCLAMNSWALVMTGMEHSLQVFTEMLVVWGFLNLLFNTPHCTSWLVVAISTLPLIRFEGAALSILSVIALIYLRRVRCAVAVVVLLILSIMGWFSFTYSLGLPVLPSSIQIKSIIIANIMGHGSLPIIAFSICYNLLTFTTNIQGCLILIGLLFICGLSLIIWRDDLKLVIVMGGFSLGVGLAHILCGDITSLGRYEAYVMALVAVSSLVLSKSIFHIPTVKMVMALMLLLISSENFLFTLKTPLASRGIYQQQYQMHRFAVDYWKRPIGVNDLGLVSYRNPTFVLDLWGLGSEEIRQMKFKRQLNAKSINDVVTRRGVDLMMIYEDWFKGLIPEQWTKVAILKTSKVAAFSGQVQIYITPKVDKGEIADLLGKFSKTLPNGSELFFPQPRPPAR